MTVDHDGSTPEVDAAADSSALSKEDVQRRVEEIMAQNSQGDDGKSKRRTRTILLVVLIVLLLLLCGIGVFLYRLLAPKSDLNKDESAGITWIRSIYGYGSAPSQQFINPNDAVTGPDGLIYITDPTNSRVSVFRGDGSFVRLIDGNLVTGEPFRLPNRLAVDSNGLLYVADIANDTLTIMDGDTKLVSAGIPGLTSVDVNDEMIVVGSAAGFAILDKDGNIKTIVGTKGSGEDQFDMVGGVSIDSNSKTIYAVDTYNNRLSAWDYAGKRKWVVTTGNPANDVKLEGGSSLSRTSSAAAALQLPVDVTVDGLGRPMVLDGFGFDISAFDPKDGKFIKSWGTNGEEDGQFMYPSTVSYDATKDWFTVADTTNRRVQVIRIAGTSEGMAGVMTGFRRFLAGPARALWPCLVIVLLFIIALIVRRFVNKRKERQADELPSAEEDVIDADASADVEAVGVE